MQLSPLWQAHARGDTHAREQLLVDNLSLVHHVALKMAQCMPAGLDVDDLVSAGTMGLMEALDSFDTSRGLAFSTFAVPRIRGSILDELRRQDHASRTVRWKARELSGARESLLHTLGRQPEPAELAKEMQIDLETLWRWQAEVEGAVQVPLDRSATDEGEVPHVSSETLTSTDIDEIDERLTRQQEIALLREAILELPSRDRTVLTLYYFEQLKMHEIARVLEISEGRVSQICARAIETLRSQMGTVRAA